MKVCVNERWHTPQSDELASLIAVSYPSLDGIAVAVNDQVIVRSAWPQYKLQDGDKITVFTAIAGG